MSPSQRAQLALLLEVAATPTPGAVDRAHDHADLRFDHFLAGAIGAGDGLADAAAGEPLGPAFERAVAGMATAQSGGNTQFGALLLLTPLVATAATGELTPTAATATVESTTVEDAVAFFRAFDAIDVGLEAPPEELADLDARQPAEAISTVEERGLTLAAVMERSAPVDGIAREWTRGFERTFDAAESLQTGSAPVLDRAASVFLELLAAEPDPHIVRRHDTATAERVCHRARAVRSGETDPAALASVLVEAGVNPGTTADLLAGGLYVGLERGLAL